MARRPKTLASSQTSPAQALGRDVLKKVLPNGLTLLVKPVRSAPVVAVNAWVRAGSVCEREAERGISHFIEHMLFKGTETLKVGELDRMIKSSGGYNNAHTRYESTDFIDILPSDKLSVALRTMADALQHSTFDAEELGRERQVVLEELSRAQDNPGFEAWNRLTRMVFKRHPYRFPVIGFKDRLQRMDRALLTGYWKRWYLPRNVIVVVVGDVDPGAAMAEAAKAFGGWRWSGPRPAPLPSEPAQKGLRFEEASGDIQGSMAVLGVPSCAELDPDAPALDMGLAILGQGLSSRLNQEVRERLKLVHGVSAGAFSGAHPGLAYVWAELEPHQIVGALRAVWAEVARMHRDLVSLSELERQKLRLEHDEASEAMSMEGMAGKLGYYECLGSDYRLADEDTARMRAVTPEDVRRAMRKYFRVDRANLVIYRSDKSAATGLNRERAQALLEGAGASRAKGAAAPGKGSALAGGLTRFKLSSGGTLIVKPVHHTPLVAAQFSFPSGQLIEAPGQAGSLNLLARTCLKGVPGMDAASMAKAMDDLGMGLGAGADPERFSVSLQALSSKIAESMALAGRSLREAELPEAEVAKERARVLKDIKDKSDSPDEFVSDLFSALHFGPGHPFGRPLDGDKGTVGGLRRAQLLALKRKVLRPQGMLAVVVGDIAPERALELFEAEFGRGVWKGSAAPKAPVPPALKPGPRRKEARLPKKQAHLVMGWPCPPVTHRDYPVLRLVNSVLGEGMDSRLFTEVRDKRGLCYSVHSNFDRRLNPGSWRVYVGTQPATLKEAEAVCRQVVAAMAGGGLTAAELKGAKAYAKGIFSVARQDFGTDARVIGNYEFWGLGAEEVERVAAALDAVTLADCARVAKQWLKPDQAVVAVVKP
ncbi:MAG TPA: pitrilysin family protein [bacterium]|jgi:zinc protease|nr:pitrilysin family protein [bacterium]